MRFQIGLLLAALLCMASQSTADPVQGGVIGGAAGAAIGGSGAAAAGAIMGAVGGKHSLSEKQMEEQRWREYYLQQEAKPSVPLSEPAPQPVGESMPTGTALIKEIQRGLSDRGYYSGPVDGLTGGDTVDAIRVYQEGAGLLTTGKPSVDLLEHMRGTSG